MAAQTADYCQHATLGAGTVDSIALSGPDISRLVVMMRSGTGPLWVTWAYGTTPGNVADPSASADNTYVVPSASLPLTIDLPRMCGQNGVTVKVLSATADVYSVMGMAGLARVAG